MRLTKKFARRFVMRSPVIIRHHHRYLGIGAVPRGGPASLANRRPRENDNEEGHPHTSRLGVGRDCDGAVCRRCATEPQGASRTSRHQRTIPQLERRVAPATGAVRLLVALFRRLLGAGWVCAQAGEATSNRTSKIFFIGLTRNERIPAQSITAGRKTAAEYLAC